MKTNFTLLGKIFFLFSFFFALSANAQAPEKMSYQAVIRNAGNALVVNQSIGMRISILQTTATGTAVYVETQTTTTNANGLASIEIGGGTVVSGTFANINWAADKYFIKTETDPSGGTNYTITGTSQLLSAPYALYAKKAGTSVGLELYAKTSRDSSLDTNTNCSNASTNNAGCSQFTSIGSNLTLPDLMLFNNTVVSPSTATGNTWNNNVFTVGSNGGGLYCIEVKAVTYLTTLYPMIDINNTGNSSSSIYGVSNGNSNTNQKPYSYRGTVDATLLLNAGDTIRIRIASGNTAIGVPILGDGSSYLKIVKLN